MKTQGDRILEKLSWLTQTKGNEPFRERFISRAWVFANFLQDNGLVTRTLANSLEDINDDFEIRAGDLTDEGRELYRGPYQKWLQSVSKKDDQTDIGILARGLKKIRAAAGRG